MPKLIFYGLILMLSFNPTRATARVQCSCPKVTADGEGNTSCSTSESGGRCTIDFNLFGPEDEQRAADLLSKYGKTKLTLPNLALNADQSLQELSSKGLKELLDAILIYMTVAAGEQSLRCPKSVPVEALGEVVIAVRGDALANRIAKAFGEDARKWSATLSDEETRKLGTGQLAFTVDRATISPGCIEFTTAGGLWLMFKTAWSPARIVPGCGSPAK